MFAPKVVALSLVLWIGGLTCCLADDAATVDSWQTSFQQVWAADSCAQEFQSWNNYWANVHAFYFGTKGYPGWFADSEKLLSHVTDTTANATVATQLTLLGRRVGGEWAKADGCRKVKTRTGWLDKMTSPGKPALANMESDLNRAANADTGNGASIEAAIAKINKQLDALNVAPVIS
jgi:hypothetical protein